MAVRQRAPSLAPEERREEIIAATLPLLRDYGADVTTSQIAQAAGIAEGTIFRVFQDKRALLRAALHEAMSADAEVTRISQIPLHQPLAHRLVAGLAATGDYQDRLWSLIRVLRDTGWHPDGASSEQHEDHPRHQMERIGAAIARLFEPEKRSLRQEPLSAARLLLGLTFANRIQQPGTSDPVKPEQLVHLFLHGALRGADTNTEPRNH